MTSLLTTTLPVGPQVDAQSILAQDGFACSLLTLAPGEETSLHESASDGKHLLFVVDGAVTVQRGEVNTILRKDQALLIPKGDEPVVAARPEGEAKVLQVDIPPRQVVTPQILTPTR